MEIQLSEVIKFYTRKAIKRTNAHVTGRGGIPQDHENKVSRPSAIFMNYKTQLKSKKSLIFEAPSRYCMSGKLNHTCMQQPTFFSGSSNLQDSCY